MRKTGFIKIKYFLIPLLCIFLLFTTASICNLCSFTDLVKTADSDDSLNTEKDIIDKEKISDDSTNNSEDDDSSKNTDAAGKDNIEENDNDNNNDKENSKPGLKLIIYEGPLFSEADKVCYYRIEAEVTGYPEPSVEFSKDDSNGAWGKYRTQVNLKQGQEYTLIAKASNPEGEVSESINLKYTFGKAGIDDTDDENNDNPADIDIEIVEEKQDLITAIILPFPEHSGYYLDNGQNNHKYREGGCIYAGDAPPTVEYPNNVPCTGVLTYDLLILEDKKIDYAIIEFKLKKKWGDTSIFNNLLFYNYKNDQWTLLQTVSSGTGGNFTLNFTDYLNNTGSLGLELKCFFDPYITDNDNSWDGWEYNQADVALKVGYYN